jgi:hypothetical protein
VETWGRFDSSLCTLVMFLDGKFQVTRPVVGRRDSTNSNRFPHGTANSIASRCY